MASVGRTTRNALSASAQMAATTAAGLVYFGYLMRTLGPEALGGWLTWLALGMVACLADLGLRESLVRRAALARAEGDDARIADLLDTTVITVAGSMTVGLLVLMTAAPHLLDLGTARDAGGWLIAGVAVMVWLQRVSDAHAAALEGLQRYDLVARNNVAGAAVGLVVLFLTIPRFGVAAASLGLIAQYAWNGIAHLRSLRVLIPGRGWLPRTWRPSLAREGLGYGLSVQGAVGSFLLIESIVKVLLARADALALLAYFDLAFRIGRGLRNLLVAGNRVLVPRLARVHAGTRAPSADAAMAAEMQMADMYVRSFHLLLFLAVPIFAAAVASAGLVSMLTRASVDPRMALAFALTLPPWFVFCAVDPVINVSMGTGSLRAVVIAHAAMLALLVLFAAGIDQGLGLRSPLAGPAILAAAAIAIIVPCIGLLWHYHRETALPLARLEPRRSLAVAILAIGAATTVGLLSPALLAQVGGVLAAAVLTLLLMRALPAWRPVSQAIRRHLSGSSA